MSKLWTSTLVGICLALVALNLVLLGQVRRLAQVNTTLGQKVTPSLRQQFDLYERRLIGRDLASAFDSLEQDQGRPRSVAEMRGYRLALYFPGETCRRSLNQEMRLLRERLPMLRELSLEPIIFLASFEETDFQTLAQQYQVAEIAFLDHSHILREALGIIPAGLLLLLSPSNVVLNARVSTGSDEDLGHEFYEQLPSLIPDQS